MSNSEFTAYRRQLLADVAGEVLEIGMGTGLNLAHYPESVTQLVAIDPNLGTHRLARKRLKETSAPVELRVLNGESLPLADHSFDCVVSTWTLCSIPNVQAAIAEIERVLKPGGRFFFVEHGLSGQAEVAWWQNRLTPLQKIIADGCHLNRDMEQLICDHFGQINVKKFYSPSFPKPVGYMYFGIADKKR
ncbi:MAG: class I SAM-dependent methyltransferase [Cyanobacteria bacterium P01_H01_bin.15]